MYYVTTVPVFLFQVMQDVYHYTTISICPLCTGTPRLQGKPEGERPMEPMARGSRLHEWHQRRARFEIDRNVNGRYGHTYTYTYQWLFPYFGRPFGGCPSNESFTTWGLLGPLIFGNSHTYVYIYTHTHAYMRTHVCMCMYMYIYTHVYAYIYIYVCMYVYVDTFLTPSVYTHMYICMQIHVHAHMCKHVC